MILSIITVVYNDRVGLEKTLDNIDSLKCRSLFEHIVVDGGSNDGSVEVCKRYKVDKYISEPDLGIYDAMNKAISLSECDYLIFMNAGDIFYSSSTVLQLADNIEKYPDVDLFYSDTAFSDGSVFVCDSDRLRIIHQSLCYKKKLHDIYGSYIVFPRLTISDYIFFSLCKNHVWMKVENVISIFDLNGVSNNSSHYYQRLLVDFFVNKKTLFTIMWLFFGHNVKKIIRWIL